MEQKWSELRLWNGGICPVGPDDRVCVLFDDMDKRYGFARDYDWSHDGGPWNIIAYRVEVKPAPLIERWANVFTDADGAEHVSDLIHQTKRHAQDAASGVVTFQLRYRQILLREVRE